MKKRMELKNVKTFEGVEGYGLSCNVYLDGKKAFNYLDDAWGGEGRIIQTFDKDLVQKIEDWIGIQPKQTSEHFEGLEIKYDLDQLINELFAIHEQKKHEKKIERLMLKAVVVMDKTNPDGYAYYSFKRPIADIPEEALKKAVQRISAKLNPNEYILNTNLPSV